MPRRVKHLPVAGAALLAVAALAAPAPAAGESLSVAAGTDPVAGQASGVDYEYDTGGVQLNLTIVVRPSSGPPCAATPGIDGANVGASGGSQYVTPTPIQPTGKGLGRVPFTFTSPGRFRICGWLARSPDDVAAGAVNEADVRLPRASVTVTAEQDAPRAGGSGLLVHVTGTSEAASDVLVTAVSGAGACPPTFDQETDPPAFDITPAGAAARVTGDFDLRFTARDLLSYRAYRVCAFLQDGTTAAAAAATGSTLVDLLLKPQLLRRPKVKVRGGAATCDGGKWKARPNATLRYAWLAGGRPVPGAAGRRLAIGVRLRGAALSCRVTASNTVGKSTATSKAVPTPG